MSEGRGASALSVQPRCGKIAELGPRPFETSVWLGALPEESDHVCDRVAKSMPDRGPCHNGGCPGAPRDRAGRAVFAGPGHGIHATAEILLGTVQRSAAGRRILVSGLWRRGQSLLRGASRPVALEEDEGPGPEEAVANECEEGHQVHAVLAGA